MGIVSIADAKCSTRTANASMTLKAPLDVRNAASRGATHDAHSSRISGSATAASSARIISPPTRSRSSPALRSAALPRRRSRSRALAFRRTCARPAGTPPSLWMRKLVDYRQPRGRCDAARAASRSPQIGPSPGFRDLNWLKPVYAGDTICLCDRGDRDAAVEQSKPEWGIVQHAQYRHQPARRCA